MPLDCTGGLLGFLPSTSKLLHLDQNTAQLLQCFTGAYDDPLPAESERVITFEALVSIKDDQSLIGQTVDIGAAIEIGTDKIWAAQKDIPIVNKTGNPLPDLVRTLLLIIFTFSCHICNPSICHGRLELALEQQVPAATKRR